MAVVLTATSGSKDANSYATVSEADDFMASIYGRSAWSTLSDALKVQLLITATRQIEAFNFAGRPLFESGGFQGKPQALSFPRVTNQRGSREPSGERAISLVASEDSTTMVVVVPGIAGDHRYPDDFWKYGSLMIYSTSSEYFGYMGAISGNVRSTGAITMASALPEPPLGMSIYLIPPVNDRIKQACFSQAWYLYQYGSDADAPRNMIARGIVEYETVGALKVVLSGRAGSMAASTPSQVCAEAMDLLYASGWYDRSISLIAGD